MGLISLVKAVLGRCETPLLDPALWRAADGEARVEVAAATALAAAGGAVRLEGRGLPAPVLVMRAAGGGLRAYLNRCPHGGRRLDPAREGEALRCCSVGHSTFDLEGNKLSGPAAGGVQPLETRSQGGELVISLAGA
jgi:nitrite reductase/ring-hydroxylating ferredoxin subunit